MRLLVCALLLLLHGHGAADSAAPTATTPVRTTIPALGVLLPLRGGSGAVLPAAGPPGEPGEVRKCGYCNLTEYESTLAYCRVTEMHFCQTKQCRKDHWAINKEYWREKLQKKKKTKTPLSDMPLPVDPTYTALGHRINDGDRYPHDDDRPPEPPEREFAQPPPELDPKVHTWNREWDGVNHVLWEAAGENDVALLKEALCDGALVNAGNPNDLYCWTPLHKGAYKGSLAAVQLLIDAGADIEARDTWNKTALHLAAEMGGHKMTLLLLEHGAEVNVRNKNNQTALHYAARNSYASIVVLLLQYAIDVNQEDIQPYQRAGMTAMDYALEHQYDDIVSLLDPVTEWRSNHTGKLREARKGKRSIYAARDQDFSDDENVIQPTLFSMDA